MLLSASATQSVPSCHSESMHEKGTSVDGAPELLKGDDMSLPGRRLRKLELPGVSTSRDRPRDVDT